MALKDLIVGLNSTVFLNTAYFGEQITVTPDGGSPAAIGAEVGEAEISEEAIDLGTVKVQIRRVIVCTDASESCGGVDMSTILDAAVTYDSVDYAVDRVEWHDETTKTACLVIKEFAKGERTREGLRERRP